MLAPYGRVLPALPQLGDGVIFRFLSGLRSSQLFVLAATLLILDVLVPDPIPFIDEALLSFLTVMLGRWKKPLPGD